MALVSAALGRRLPPDVAGLVLSHLELCGAPLGEVRLALLRELCACYLEQCCRILGVPRSAAPDCARLLDHFASDGREVLAWLETLPGAVLQAWWRHRGGAAAIHVFVAPSGARCMYQRRAGWRLADLGLELADFLVRDFERFLSWSWRDTALWAPRCWMLRKDEWRKLPDGQRERLLDTLREQLQDQFF